MLTLRKFKYSQFHTLRHFSVSRVRLLNPLLPIDGLLDTELSDSDTRKKVKKNKTKILIPANADSFKTSASQENVGQSQNQINNQKTNNNGNNTSNSNNKNSDNNNNTNETEYEEQPKSSREKFQDFAFKCLETSGITFASLFVLGVAGITYHKFYGIHVITKMSAAFDKGDDAFELTMHKRTTQREGDWIERPEQELLDLIINGTLVGRYFLVSGEKGCGKSSMILNSMKKIDSFNCAFIDAHSDPEIFRIRLGKALDFAYHEDYIGSLFSIRGPRDTTALLDIERAFNKLESVAVRRIKKYGRPLVLVINNSHLIKDDDEGAKLVELLQQKAETLSGSGLVTIIFNSDDYWLYERLKKLGTRLENINVRDFDRNQSVKALSLARNRYFNEVTEPSVANQVYDLIGGRPQHLSEVAKHPDMVKACHILIDREKTWFLNQCGLLGMGMDDDVNESGKFSTSAMLLMKLFVEMYHDEQKKTGNGLATDGKNNHKLPELPLWRARQIMTRNDYIQRYDNLNIFTIDSQNSFVRADSIPMMRGFLEIAEQEGFDKLLEETLDRVAEIESLGRTRELIGKDLLLGGRYKLRKSNLLKDEYSVQLDQHQSLDYQNSDDPIKLQPTTLSGGKKFWKNRLTNESSQKDK